MKKAPQLTEIREQITGVDKALLELLAKRRQLSLEVARSKEVDIRPIRDVSREKELLARLVQQGREQGLDAHYVLSLYQTIIEDSVLNQQAYLQLRANHQSQKQRYTVAYLGARGSYSYLAAHRYCERRDMEMEDLGCANFDDIARAVESGHADYGFLPIENTSSGSINEVYDLLQHTHLSIVGETTIEVNHCLLAKHGSELEQICTLYAHPQPISQCSRYLAAHPELRLQYCASSAEAMEKVRTGDHTVAAIGSAEGGALYQLEALVQDLANQKINQSRFIVVARKAVIVPEQLPAKTTLIMATAQRPGALVDALTILKNHQLNMSKLESRPIPGTPWEEMFYLDIDGNLQQPALQQALQELENITRFIKVLGCYSSENVKPTRLENSQLLIEPQSSKANHGAATPVIKPNTIAIHCGELSVGDGCLCAIAALEKAPADIRYRASMLKEMGFQAVIVDACAELAEQQTILNHAGLQTIVNIEQPTDLAAILPNADMVFLAGSQMYNKALLTALGSLNVPVILERNMLASVQDWLASAQLFMSYGNKQLILCESGGRSLNNPEQVALDLSALVTAKAECALPILVNATELEASTTARQLNAACHLKVDGVVLPARAQMEAEQQRQQLAALYQL